MRSNERGVSLLEFALTLPLLMVIVGSMVDLGFTLRRVQVISDAAKHGARFAAARSFVNVFLCEETKDEMSIEQIAREATAQYLDNAGFKREEISGNSKNVIWEIEPDVILQSVGLVDPMHMVKVKVRQNQNSCLICWQGIFGKTLVGAESTFALDRRNKCAD